MFISGSKGVIKNLAPSEEQDVCCSTFNHVFNSNQDAIAIFDLNGVIDFANKSFYELFGYQSQEQLHGLRLENFFPPDSARQLAGMIRKPSADKVLKLPEASGLKQNGQLISVSIYAFIIFRQPNQSIGLFCSIRDNTERKEAEQKLKQSEAKYRLLAENVTDVIWTLDMNLKFTYISPSIKKMRGYTPEEALPQSLDQFLPAKSFSAILQIFHQALEQEKSSERDLHKIWSFEAEQICKDGSIIYTESTAKFLRDENNQPIGILGVTRDITERKRAEEEKQKLLSQIAHQEKMNSLGQFAAGMAHEINNPLAYIKANLKVLAEYRKNIKEVFNAYEKLSTDVSNRSGFVMLDKTNREVSELAQKLDLPGILKDIRNLVSESEEGVERIRNIVQSLKRFTEPPKSMPELADVNDIIENILNLISSDISRKGRLVKDLGCLPRIQCHPQELGQVFINIITNAANALKENGEIRISTREENGHIRVQIQDNGIGMTREQLGRIFDPFYSGPGVSSRKGLGLSVSYGIVKSHGGEILVESEPGKGSTFVVTLPTAINSKENLT